MGQKVTMNEGQLREKVYNMVCESLEAVMNEGKTFKDQKSWNKKGFQKSNKFQKNDKYQNWKNGSNVNSDQDECMNEGFGDRVSGAVQGFRQGKEAMHGHELDTNRYNTLLNGVNAALDFIKQINNPSPEVNRMYYLLLSASGYATTDNFMENPQSMRGYLGDPNVVKPGYIPPGWGGKGVHGMNS